MTDPELPPDLAALERRLADRPRAGPADDLGPRLLAATRAALRDGPVDAPTAGWASWAALAAAVLVGINLSMSLAADTDWDLTPGVDPAEVAATWERLRAAAPDLPESEFRRQALLARAGARLTPTLNLNLDRERDRWDVR
jgi:hypothetical protein